MGTAMRATFQAVEDFEPVQETSEQPANGAVYPDSDLGRALAEVARVIRGDVGVEVLTVDQGDWDHHTTSAPSTRAGWAATPAGSPPPSPRSSPTSASSATR